MKKRVVIGLSGGVDSSVAAALLIEQGYDVVGMFMRNWHNNTVVINNECPWIEDSNDALAVAEHLGIPFQVIDLSEEYKTRIVNYMFDEYKNGRTPNPDILCNREIKFDVFLKACMELDADYVATGHYCQKDEKDGIFNLLAGADSNKDQSYFLCQINQKQLSKILFPIGHLEKHEVRQIAENLNLPTAHKKDSQGLCFVGKVKLPTFLQQQLKTKTGEIIEIDKNWEGYKNATPLNGHIYTPTDGKYKSDHIGAHFFTIGQRKGLELGGNADPMFVIGTNTKTNTVYVGMGKNHPGLWRQNLWIANKDIHWLREDLTLLENESSQYNVRVRYRQTLKPATLTKNKNGLIIQFENTHSAIAPGQFAAWYLNNKLIGSGSIY